MAGHDEVTLSSAEVEESARNYRRRLLICSALFFLFFIFYVSAAVIQTPAFAGLAGALFLGMPFGLFLSLMIFPVSWIIIVIFFVTWR